jgi:hypothetical protein
MSRLNTGKFIAKPEPPILMANNEVALFYGFNLNGEKNAKIQYFNLNAIKILIFQCQTSAIFVPPPAVFCWP